MDPITAIGFAAGVIQLINATSQAVRYLNNVKDAPKDRAKLAQEITGVLSLFTDLRYRVEETNSTDPWFIGLRSLGGKGGPLAEFKRAMEELVEKLTPTTGVKKFGRVLRWTLDKKEIDCVLSKIERLKTLIGLALQKDCFTLSLAVKEHVDVGFEKIRINCEHPCITIELKQKINRWLAAPDPSSNHNTACKKRQPTTGRWFTQGKEFADWKIGSNSFIWLHGIPGCGKTILCSTIIQDVLSQSQINSTAVAYFYFDFNNSDKQRSERLVRSLIVQLSSQCLSLPETLHSVYSGLQNKQQQPKTEDLMTILQRIVESFNQVYILIDALDECTDREDLLQRIEELISWELDNLHILATSREEMDIEVSFQPLVTCQLCIQSALVDADIRVHVLDRLSHDSKLNKWPVNVQKEIEDTLTKGAKGMFRWVICQLDVLRKCLKLDSLMKALKALPKTLDETYERILSNIDEQYEEDALRVLQWLCFSVRPMRLNEMVEVLAVDLTNNPRFRPEQRFPDPRGILVICSTLVSVIAAPKETAHVKASGKEELRLAHFSVKEYLISDRIKATTVHRYHIAHIHANISIVKTCLTYLLHFESPAILTAESVHEFPLSRYAAEHWTEHYKFTTSDAIGEPLDVLGYNLVQSKEGCFINWLKLFDPDAPWPGPNLEREYTQNAAPQYYMSLLGVSGVLRLLLESGADVNAQGGECHTALQAASESGHEEVVRLLVEHGADINAQGGVCRTALQAASYRGHETVVQLLLEQGADVKAQSSIHVNALQAASYRGHVAVVRLLLEWGADINAQGEVGHTALQVASYRGHVEVVRLLLEWGADVNAQGGVHDNALQAALYNSHEMVVQLLESALKSQ